MGRRRVFVVWLLVFLGALQTVKAGPSPAEQAKLDALDAAIDGYILYTKDSKVYKMQIGVWTPVELGDGNYARWSPDGQRIAVLYNSNLYVMDADGTNPVSILSGLIWNINPIEFSTTTDEVFFTQSNYGLRAAEIKTPPPALRDVALYHKYFGEPAVSLSGTRAVARVAHDLYAIDINVGDRKYAAGCSPGVSPCGAYVMNNTGEHDTLQIRDWDGSNMFEVDATTAQPDGEWDNHHWSNHPDYIAVQGEADIVGEIYIMQVSANDCTRVTWVGGCVCPDLFVESVLTISGTITEEGGSNPVANRIIRATNGPQVIETQTDDNGDYMIVGALSGDYTISMPGATLSNGTNPVTVSGADVTGADFDAQLEDADATADGLDDPWEYKFFGDITSTDGTGDADGDGKSDLQEYLDGTNPTIANASSGGGCGPIGGEVALALVALLAVARVLRRRRDAS